MHGEKVTEQMVHALIEAFAPVVDFQAIAKSIMGKHAKKANVQQLVKFYMKSLITFEVKVVTVLKQTLDFDPKSGR